MKTTNFLFCISFLLIGIFACKKEAGTGGNATITLFPEYDKSGSNSSNLTAIKGASVYVWFDGSNSTGGFFGPLKNPETADLKIFGDTNKIFVTIPNLKIGTYAWRILRSDPSGYPFFRSAGSKEIKWKERNKNITIHTTLHY